MEKVQQQKRYDFVIATIEQYLSKSNDAEDDLKQAILQSESSEDVLLAEELIRIGIERSRITRAAWDDPTFNWSECKIIVIRSVWNYHEKPAQFISWLRSIQATSQVVNNVDLMLWNIDKVYLKELSEQHDILIAPTQFIAQNDLQNTLQQIIEKRGWTNNKVVVKPAISAGAIDCLLIQASQAPDYEQIFQKLVERGGVLVQEFMQNIESKGETSSIFFTGQLQHTVLKIPKSGDFRVQREYGGSCDLIEFQDNTLQDFCSKVLNALPSMPLIARVDTVIDSQGNICLQEVEVIDCFLYLYCRMEGVKTLAEQLYELFKKI